MKFFSKDNTALHTALQANALFSDITGLIAIFAAKPLAEMMGIPSPSYLVAIGVGVLIWAVVLFLQTQKPEISTAFASFVIAGDVLWIIASDLLIFSASSPLTITGKRIVGVIAFTVLDIAIWQFITLRKQTKLALNA